LANELRLVKTHEERFETGFPAGAALLGFDAPVSSRELIAIVQSGTEKTADWNSAFEIGFGRHPERSAIMLNQTRWSAGPATILRLQTGKRVMHFCSGRWRIEVSFRGAADGLHS